MSDSSILENADDVCEADETDNVPGSSVQERRCPWCPKAFINGPSLKLHLGRCHVQELESVPKRKEGSGRLACPVGCDGEIASYDVLLRHCADEHEFRAEHMNMRFEDEKEFKEWLVEVSVVAGGFARKRGERKTADGSVMGDLHCVFDGKKRETPSIRAPERMPYNRRIPSKKLGFACPAYIRYTIEVDGTVTCRAQLQHFGHDPKPVLPRKRRTPSSIDPNARKIKRRGIYPIDDSYHESSSRVPSMDEDDMEVDERGMVNLFSIPSLEKARFVCQSACTSMELAFAEAQFVPHENAPHIGLLVEKLNDLAGAAGQIEAILKAISTVSSNDTPPHEEEVSLEHDPNKVNLHGLRKEVKEEIVEGNGEEESFEQASDGEDLDYHNEVAEEVVVDHE